VQFIEASVVARLTERAAVSRPVRVTRRAYLYRWRRVAMRSGEGGCCRGCRCCSPSRFSLAVGRTHAEHWPLHAKLRGRLPTPQQTKEEFRQEQGRNWPKQGLHRKGEGLWKVNVTGTEEQLLQSAFAHTPRSRAENQGNIQRKNAVTALNGTFVNEYTHVHFHNAVSTMQDDDVRDRCDGNTFPLLDPVHTAAVGPAELTWCERSDWSSHTMCLGRCASWRTRTSFGMLPAM